jgi:hypothetical protein
MNYTIHHGGLMAEDAYPYDPMPEACEAAKNFSVAVQIKGFVQVPTKNASALLQALNKGPVSVGIDADCDEFQVRLRRPVFCATVWLRRLVVKRPPCIATTVLPSLVTTTVFLRL